MREEAGECAACLINDNSRLTLTASQCRTRNGNTLAEFSAIFMEQQEVCGVSFSRLHRSRTLKEDMRGLEMLREGLQEQPQDTLGA